MILSSIPLFCKVYRRKMIADASQGLRGFPDKWTLGTKFSACRDGVADMHVNLCSQIRCLLRQYHIIGDSPFRSISERAFSFPRKIISQNGCTIRVSQWEQVKGQTFTVPWQPNTLTRYHPRQICKSEFCTLVFSLAFRYHIREGRRKPWRKSSSCCWRFWWAHVRR